jgi:glycosyltransferase involved in cell wall biosynthesis
MPRVSVLLPSYNHERFLRECVESILSQTYQDFEIIAIDDGSKDGSVEILRAYGDKLRLFVNDPNLGTYATLNRALSLAEGEYAAVMNSDDVWKPTKLMKQVEAMDADPMAAICHTFGQFIDQNGTVITGRPMGFEFPRTPAGRALPFFVRSNCAVASSILMRTSIAKSIGGFDETFRTLGDWDMWLRMLENGTLAFVDEPLTLYRVHGANTIYATDIVRQEEIRIRERIAKRASELLETHPAMRSSLAHNSACLGLLYSIIGRPRDARKRYVESLRLNPKRMKSVIRYFMTFLPLAVRKKTL